jgi:adenylate kinase family enzyme
MQRICILGCSGSGKSTFSYRLAQAMSLPLVHLDREYWQPGWQTPSSAEWHARHRALIAKPAWIIDGNYSSTTDERMARADTIVLFDRPRWLCFLRIAKRVATSYGKVRVDMAPDCPEQFDWEFLVYVWQFKTKHQPRLETAMARYRTGRRIVIARSDRDLDAFLAEARSMQSGECNVSHA